MVAMNCYITIGDYEFKACHSFETIKSWKNLVQTGTIQMHNIPGLIGAIKEGDAVEISAWYDDDAKTVEFTGYVSELMPNKVVTIKCEDEMWKLRQETFSGSWKSITLRQLLNTIVPGAVIDCPDVTLSPFRIDKATKTKVLQTLKDEYLLTIYYRGKTLFAGLPYIEKGLPDVTYHFQKNALVDGLVFKRAASIKRKVIAISVFPDNRIYKKEYGDSDGETITLHYYNKTAKEVDALANEALNRRKYDGYSGTFRSLGGLPFCDHGYACYLEDDDFPEREQGVFADVVRTVYNSTDGWCRYITPGRRIEQL